MRENSLHFLWSVFGAREVWCEREGGWGLMNGMAWDVMANVIDSFLWDSENLPFTRAYLSSSC